MDAEIFLRLINEIDFVLDDIAEIKDQLHLTKSEISRLSGQRQWLYIQMDFLCPAIDCFRPAENSEKIPFCAY